MAKATFQVSVAARLKPCPSTGRRRLPAKLYNRSVYSLYSLLLFLALIVSTPWWLLQMLRHGKYRTGWSERLGKVPDRLFNEVSPRIRSGSMRSRWARCWPSRGWSKSSKRSCPAGALSFLPQPTPARSWRASASARTMFSTLPLDLPFAVRAYLQALRPKLLVLAESEFWPNLLRWAESSGAAVAVVNARVSDRSLPGYLRFRGLLQRVMQNVDLFLAQSDEDARRLVQIGAPAERVQVSGNLKFEVKPPAEPAIVVALFDAASEREEIGPVIVAGSTLEGEETMLLEMFRQVVARYPGALLVLAPRHPERFDVVASLLASSGLASQRRSAVGWSETRSQAASFCSIRLASWPACTNLPTSRSSAAAWCRVADITCWKPRSSARPFWSARTRRTSAISSRSFAEPTRCGWSLRNRLRRRCCSLLEERRRAGRARPARPRGHALAAGRNGEER